MYFLALAISGSTVFKTAGFNHSPIPPSFILPDFTVLPILSLPDSALRTISKREPSLYLRNAQTQELFGLTLVCRTGAFLQSFTVGVVVCIPCQTAGPSELLVNDVTSYAIGRAHVVRQPKVRKRPAEVLQQTRSPVGDRDARGTPLPNTPSTTPHRSRTRRSRPIPAKVRISNFSETPYLW